MWYRCEGCDCPGSLDTTSSNRYNYVRRNFEQLPATEELPERWTWEEQKIEKKDWETYRTVMAHDTTLEDVQSALIELAEIITEG